MDFLYCRGLRFYLLADICSQGAFGHPPPSVVRIEILFRQVIAISAAQITDRPDRFGHYLQPLLRKIRHDQPCLLLIQPSQAGVE